MGIIRRGKARRASMARFSRGSTGKSEGVAVWMQVEVY